MNDYKSLNHGAGEYVRGEVHTNSIKSVWAVLKRSITGTWHHVSKKHLARYVNEGNCQVDTLAALAGGIGGKRLRYQDLVA